MTLTTPVLGWFVIRKPGYYTAYLCIKFDDCSFSHTKDSIGNPKFKMGFMTLTTYLLRVIFLLKQVVALTGRNMTRPPCSRVAIIRLEASWRCRLVPTCRPAMQCCRRWQTPVTVNSLAPWNFVNKGGIAFMLAVQYQSIFPNGYSASCGPRAIPPLFTYLLSTLIFSIFYFPFFPFLTHFIFYSFHLFSCFFIPSHSTRIVPLCFQAGCRRRRLSMAFLCWFCVIGIY